MLCLDVCSVSLANTPALGIGGGTLNCTGIGATGEDARCEEGGVDGAGDVAGEYASGGVSLEE